MKQLVECVPNFSEGRNHGIIRQIAEAIESVEGVMLLNVDPGEAANRTVYTFVGTPEGVCEAAFRAVSTAGRLIDMRQQHGTHPRIGATDVLPIIPVSGISLQECAQLARQLAERIAGELRIPCYGYEASALRPERKNLAVCRRGEYEALPQRLADPQEAPDYGARPFDEDVARTGCTVVGARDYLIAVNFNLDSTSVPLANAIAFDVREKGRPTQPGTLKGTKALGWYIDEYGIAQVSMNITDIRQTPLHVAFDEVCRCARLRGVRVTGTEIIGLVPRQVLIDAGCYYLEKEHRPTDVPEQEIVQAAVDAMGLSDLCPFEPRKRVIEYLLEDRRTATQS